MALKSRHATWLFCQNITSKSTFQQYYLFYSITLSSEAIALQIEKNIRRLKWKLSTFLDLPDSPFLSQNPSISTPTKKKKLSSFSQSQPTQHIQEISIYSESFFSKDPESAIRTQKSQLFVKIPKKTSLDLSQYSKLS